METEFKKRPRGGWYAVVTMSTRDRERVFKVANDADMSASLWVKLAVTAALDDAEADCDE